MIMIIICLKMIFFKMNFLELITKFMTFVNSIEKIMIIIKITKVKKKNILFVISSNEVILRKNILKNMI